MTIISCPGYGAARRQETTTSCCTRTVTCPCIMPEILCVSRTRSHECSERLEPDIGELIRPVLRGLRHEVMSVFVMRSSFTHNPVFYHWYATRTCGTSNRTVRSSWDNVCLTCTGGPWTVRNKDDCQRHG